jgi:hypothetical protein
LEHTSSINQGLPESPKLLELNMSQKYDLVSTMKHFLQEKLTKISSETVGWIAILCLHAATIPSLFAMMSGLSSTPPSVDVVLMVWTALFLFLVKATIQKDILNLLTIGIGFLIQAVMMALIFFK